LPLLLFNSNARILDDGCHFDSRSRHHPGRQVDRGQEFILIVARQPSRHDANTNNLSIEIMGTQDKITVLNWFSGAASAQLQEFKTADGSKLDNINNNVVQLVQAMASYSSANPGFDPTSVAQAPNDPTLQTAIATAWHA
jgi:hemolysin type calcium binding protein